MKRIANIIQFFFCLALLGCADQAALQADPVAQTTCPKIATYTKEDENAQADAIAALPENSPLEGPLQEWAMLRAELEKCQTKVKSFWKKIGL